MFDKLEGNIWLDGKIIPWDSARIHIMTHALHYGTSVYDGLRSRKTTVFRGYLHFQRFLKSATLLDFEIPYDIPTLIQGTQTLLDTGEYNFGYIRALAWCGSQSMLVSHRQANVHVAVMIWERPMPYPFEIYQTGLNLHLATWRRPCASSAPVHSKAAGLYMISAMAKRKAELEGFDDAVLLDTQNRIAEATSSNIFFVNKGMLYTPLPHSFLKGLTRGFVIEQAHKEGITIIEKDMYIADLSSMEAAFLTGTAVGIVPIASIQADGNVYKFQPDATTRKLQALYQEAFSIFE